VLEGSVGSQDRVIGLDNRGGGLRSGVDAELQLALLAVVDGQALHEQSTKAGTSATTEGVEDEEALEAAAVVGNAAHLVKDLVNELLANGVVTTGIVVRSVLLARDHMLGMEKATVRARANLVDDIGLQIAVDRPGHVLALAYEAILSAAIRRSWGQ